LAVGPCDAAAPVVVCDAPAAPPAGFAAGLAGADFAGGAFFSSAAALAVPIAPSKLNKLNEPNKPNKPNKPARTNALEPWLMRISRFVILIPHSLSGFLCPRAIPDARMPIPRYLLFRW
jgi:hypothetical protein